MPKLYNRSWEKARRVHLAHNRYCVICRRHGRQTRATVVDHITPHKGDKVLFWDRSNWQSLCQPCHDGFKRSVERRGQARGVDLAGRPVDPAHPWNDGRHSIPHGMRPSGIPVRLVVGPPASGKSTHIRQNAAQSDVVIDLDRILVGLGFDAWTDNVAHVKRALRYRDTLLYSLADRTQGVAWFATLAPTSDEQRAWRQAIGHKCEIVRIDTPIEDCRVRIMTDLKRKKYRQRLLKVLNTYELRMNS